MTAPPIPTRIPLELTPGDTWQFQLTLRDYPPSDGWALVVSFRGPSVLDVTAVASPDNSSWLVTADASATASLGIGRYVWVASASRTVSPNPLERHSALTGVTTLIEQIQTAAAGDTVSHNEKMLAAIESLIAGRIPDDVEHYQIGTRALSKVPIKELFEYRESYAFKVWRERHPHDTVPLRQVTFR